MARFGSIIAAIALTSLSACTSGAPKDSAPAPAAPVAESPVVVNEKWRVKHEADYRRDWVSIAGLFPLKSGANTAGSAKGNDIVLPASTPAKLGRFVRKDKQVRFEPAPNAPVLLRQQPVTAPIDLNDDAGSGADVSFGQAGPDVLIGGAGNDVLSGDDPGTVPGDEEGGDYLDGGQGDDELFGNGGEDILVGGPGARERCDESEIEPVHGKPLLSGVPRMLDRK